MILHDRVIVVSQVVRLGPNGKPIKDVYGEIQYDEVESAWPAEVQPLSSDEKLAPTTTVISQYRFVLPAAAVNTVASDSAVTWRTNEYEVEGDVEPHMIRGRVHHIEFIAKRVSY